MTRVQIVFCLVLLVVLFSPVGALATTWGLVVGVAFYVDPAVVDLTYASTDALSFAQALQEQTGVPPSRITLLTDDEATRAAIEEAFSDVAAKARPEDTVIIYISGHGASVPDRDGDEADGDGNDEAFLPYDAVKGDAASYILDDALGRWIAAIPAERVALFLDSCYSGGQARAMDVSPLLMKGPSDSIARDILTDAMRKQRRGILAACEPSQLAWENRGLQHGVFTYFLLQGMADNSADTNGDGAVSFGELGGYVTEKLDAWSRGRAEKQHPVVEGPDVDSLVIVPDINARCRTRLVAHYTFDGNAKDEIGGRDGTNNGAQLVEGIISQAYEFDNVPDHNTYIVTDSSFEPGPGPFAVSVWFKTDAVVPAGRILSTHNDWNWYAPTYELMVELDGTLTFRTNDGPKQRRQDLHSENTHWNDGEWHHVVMQRTTTGRKELWIDGTLEASEYYSVQDIRTRNQPLTIGATAYNNWASGYSFHGAVDDLRIYEGTLSEDEIRGLLALGFPEEAVTFPDTQLEQAIREALHRPTGPLLSVDLLGIKELDLSGKGIHDLTGLEYCRDLKDLTINDAEIVDYSPLSVMHGLVWLSLKNDHISDIFFVSSLRTLEILNLANNDISDITPIAGLPVLWKVFLSENRVESLVPLPPGKEIHLDGNGITSIEPLAESTRLRVLSIAGNRVTDLSPLTDLQELRSLTLYQIVDLQPLVDNPSVARGDTIDLRGNPLDVGETSQASRQIERLRARGVTVIVD
jgi:internalin A